MSDLCSDCCRDIASHGPHGWYLFGLLGAAVGCVVPAVGLVVLHAKLSRHDPDNLGIKQVWPSSPFVPFSIVSLVPCIRARVSHRSENGFILALCVAQELRFLTAGTLLGVAIFVPLSLVPQEQVT